MDISRERAGVYCGIAAPLVFGVLYTIAVVGDPEYVFFDNYLSDLGVGSMAWAFNSAVIIAGALTILFVLFGVRPKLRGSIPLHLAMVMTVVAAAFLILVGVFTEDHEGTHYIVSIGFFMSFQVALLFYLLAFSLSNAGGDLTHASGRRMSIATDIVFSIGLVLTIAGFDPRTETIAVLIIIVWGLAMGLTLLYGGADADTF